MYLAQERRQYILRLLEQRGSVRTTALARELGVTDETIRTDLVDLHADGLLHRVHGGARYIIPQHTESATDMRLDVQLVQLVAAHMESGMRVYADDCDFTRVLIAQLSQTPCTFVTPSPQLLTTLAPGAVPHKVFCTGGELNKKSGLLSHPEAEEVMQRRRPQLAILCPQALRPAQAFYRHSTAAAWAAAAAQVAEKTLVVVPADALSEHSEHPVHLPEYTLITEDNIPQEFHGIPTETVPYISEASLYDSSFY